MIILPATHQRHPACLAERGLSMVTMKDIAEKCGVSTMTVSRAINGSDLVSEATKTMILETCERLGYIPNSAAKSLVTKETNMIGLVVPDIDYYYADIIKSITHFLEERGYGLLLCAYDQKREKEIEYLYYLLQGRVDGIILFPFNPRRQDYVNVIDKIPMVFANKFPDGLNANFVGSDNYAGAVKMMEHILSKGHRRIGLIHTDLSHKTFMDRLRGYKDVLAQNNMPYDDSIICDTKLTFQNGYRCAEYLVSKNVDAIFALNDVCAMGAVRYCSDNNISVPGDIGIAGYDNIQYLEMFDHKLTTVDYNGVLLGEQVASVVLEEVCNPQIPKRSIILNPQLIAGRTV